MASHRRRPLSAPLLSIVLLAVAAACPARAADGDDPAVPTVQQQLDNGPTAPDYGPPISGENPGIDPMPYAHHMPYFGGPTVIGPGGVMPQPELPRRVEAPKPKVPTPAERAASIRKALAPKPSFAFSRRTTLDRLYGKLAVAADAEEAKGLATLIGNIWLRSGSDTAALLMQRAIAASEAKNYTVALDLLDRIVEMNPTWPEAWNKRASVRFAAGNLDGSMEDVEHVLKLEPNHFAALEGMGLILQHTGFDKRALQVYRRALEIYPHQPEIETLVNKLSFEVEGQGL